MKRKKSYVLLCGNLSCESGSGARRKREKVTFKLCRSKRRLLRKQGWGAFEFPEEKESERGRVRCLKDVLLTCCLILYSSLFLSFSHTLLFSRFTVCSPCYTHITCHISSVLPCKLSWMCVCRGLHPEQNIRSLVWDDVRCIHTECFKSVLGLLAEPRTDWLERNRSAFATFTVLIRAWDFLNE